VQRKAKTIQLIGFVILLFVFLASCSRKRGEVVTDPGLDPSPSNLVSIAVTPQTAQMVTGTKLKLTVTGKYDNQTTKIIATGLTWRSLSTIVTVNTAGEVTAGSSTGQTTIVVTSGAFSDKTTLTVLPNGLNSISVETDNPSIFLQGTAKFIAKGHFKDGTNSELTSLVTWSSSDNNIATINSAGEAKGLSIGTVTITAIASPDLGSFQGTSSLQVQDITLSNIVVVAKNGEGNAPLPVGVTRQLQAIGSFSNGTTADITSTVTWESLNPAIASVNTTGLSIGVAAGSAMIRAVSGNKSGQISLTINSAKVVSILVTPSNKSIFTGQTQQFTAIGLFDNEASQDISSQVNWISSSPSVAAINKSSGLATAGTVAGTTTISALFDGKFGTTQLTVSVGTLKSISVTPKNPSMAKGTTQQFKADGTYEMTIGTGVEFSIVDISSSVTWVSSLVTVATTTSGGFVTAKATGTSLISASLSGMTGSTTLTVTDAALDFVAVTTPSNNYIVFIDGGKQFIATGYFTDGTTQDLTRDVDWSVGTPTIAKINNDSNSVLKGYATGQVDGSTAIKADFGGKSGTATLTVTFWLLTSIRLEPRDQYIATGTALQFKATGVLGDGSEQDITSLVAWVSSKAGIASITTGGTNAGLATAGFLQGTTVITASFSQGGAIGKQASTNLTVTSASLTGMTIAPAALSIPAGIQKQYVAIGTYSNQSTQNISSLVTWRTGSSTVATITNIGLLTTNTTGTTSVTASFGVFQATSSLIVNSAILDAVSVTPENISLGIDTSRQYTATANFNNLSSYDVTSYAVFNSTVPSVAIINQAGFATGKAIGTTMIQTIFLGVTGSTNLTVQSLTLKSITVTSTATSSPVGNTLQFQATGNFWDGSNNPSTQDLTNVAAWSTSSYSMATVSNIIGSNGLVTALNSGTVEIRADFGGEHGSAFLIIGQAAPVSVIAGEGHTCTLLTDGRIRCWGKNGSGQLGEGNGTKKNGASPKVVTGTYTAASVSLGGSHTCYILDNGLARCWGSNQFGQLGIGTSADTDSPTDVRDLFGIEEMATGLSHTCALFENETIQCWGANASGQVGDGTMATSTSHATAGVSGVPHAITAGGAHTCAIIEFVAGVGGSVQCWGENGLGQLGSGSFTDSSTPVNVSGITTATAIVAGGNHTCALLGNGNVHCWGENLSGQLGNGTNSTSTTPVSVGLSSVAAIAAGRNHTCAVFANGTAKCWGDNSKGQLGNGGTTSSNIPVAVSGITGSADGISTGATHTCTLSGIVKCWGSNEFGQLGNGADIISKPPILAMASASTVQAGFLHTCAVISSQISCMGDNSYGQLGNGTNTSTEQPVNVIGISNASEVTAGKFHTCAKRSDNTVQCWGANTNGQLGNETTNSTSTPVMVSGMTAASLSAGGSHTCALLNDINKTVQCWGANGSGQLGDTTQIPRSSPVSVSNILDVTAISAGGSHTCALLVDKTVKCWGNNAKGQLGDGTMTGRTAPVAVLSVTDVIGISTGESHTCAVLSSAAGGAVKCWGDNTSGQLGNGNNTTPNPPAIITVSNISALLITTGENYSCAVLSNNTMKCWGQNLSAQLGDETISNSKNLPVVVGVSGTPSITTAMTVTAGEAHTCSLLSSNAVKCWGNASYGQIGDQVILIETSPVNVVGL